VPLLSAFLLICSLEPMWTAASWAETTYTILASFAYVVWGLGMVMSSFPSAWAGWASIAIGGLSAIGVIVAPSRFAFPSASTAGPDCLGCGSGDLMTNSSSPRNTRVKSAVHLDVARKVADVGDLPSRKYDCIETGVHPTSRPIASPR
jgi:hypothetical protein